MNAPERFFLPDVQASPDDRQLAIQQVGVKGLRYPLTLLDAAGQAHHDRRHAGDDRRPAARSQGHPHVALRRTARARACRADARRPARTCSTEMLLRLEASSGRIELRFPYFIRKTAPVSGVESLLDYDAADRRRAERRRQAD